MFAQAKLDTRDTSGAKSQPSQLDNNQQVEPESIGRALDEAQQERQVLERSVPAAA